MRIDEITIEVRDHTFARVGQIDTDIIADMKLTKRLNNVGSWSLSLPVEYDMAQKLAASGMGIVVLGPNDLLLMSGRVLNITHEQDIDDPLGTWTFQGVDDNIHLADALAWPQPDNPDASTQNLAYDVRTGNAESIMRQYVAFNIGDGSTRVPPANWGAPERLIAGLTLEDVNQNRGATVTGRARFDQLGMLLGQLAAVGGLGFDVRQVNDKLVFTIYEPQDRSGLIRMDIDNDMLESVSYGVGSPTGTRIIVAGQGQGDERTFKFYTDATAAAAETAWGRKIEVFKDRRDTNDNTELDQAGAELLDANGRTVTSLNVKPADEVTMVFGVDWYLGDIVTVVVNDEELQAVVTEAIIAIDEEGIRVGATIGDPTGFDYESKLISMQKNTEKRLAFLEKNAEAGDPYTKAEVDGLVDPLGVRMGDAEALAIANLNKIINGDFRINQRGATSGASLASGAYFVDRWRSGSASNAVTWTGDDIAGRVLTVPSGKVIQQIIERVNMPAGQYTVMHDGTAQVCMFNEGGSAPAKAAGPVTVTLDGSANVAVEFGAGTVSNVRVLPGTKAYPFIPRMITDELLLCQRYYYRLTATAGNQRLAYGTQPSTTRGEVLVTTPTPMRTTPTPSAGFLAWTDSATFSVNISSISRQSWHLASTGTAVFFEVNFAASGAAARPGALCARGTLTGSDWLALDAEL